MSFTCNDGGHHVALHVKILLLLLVQCSFCYVNCRLLIWLHRQTVGSLNMSIKLSMMVCTTLGKWSAMSTRLWSLSLSHLHFPVRSIAGSIRREMTFGRWFIDVGEQTCMGCLTKRLWQTKLQHGLPSIQTTTGYIVHLTVMPASSYYWSTSQHGNDVFCCDMVRIWYSWMPHTKQHIMHCHCFSCVFTPTRATSSWLWSLWSEKTPRHSPRHSICLDSMSRSGIHLLSWWTLRKWKWQLSVLYFQVISYCHQCNNHLLHVYIFT